MSIATQLYEISHNLDCLTSLIVVLVDRIEAVPLYVDEEKAAKIAADLARIAFDGLALAAAKLTAIEQGMVAIT